MLWKWNFYIHNYGRITINRDKKVRRIIYEKIIMGITFFIKYSNYLLQ